VHLQDARASDQGQGISTFREFGIPPFVAIASATTSARPTAPASAIGIASAIVIIVVVIVASAISSTATAAATTTLLNTSSIKKRKTIAFKPFV